MPIIREPLKRNRFMVFLAPESWRISDGLDGVQNLLIERVAWDGPDLICERALTHGGSIVDEIEASDFVTYVALFRDHATVSRAWAIFSLTEEISVHLQPIVELDTRSDASVLERVIFRDAGLSPVVP